jgi:Leucine-rich repeat (LRR) protein
MKSSPLSYQVLFFLVYVTAVDKNIVDITEGDLRYFINLSKIDLSENHIKNILKLSALTALAKLEMQNNNIEVIDFMERDAVEPLEQIDLAFNIIQFTSIKNLNVHPNLRYPYKSFLTHLESSTFAVTNSVNSLKTFPDSSLSRP